MALKPVITQEMFEKLPAAVQAEYDKQEDGTYLVSIVAENGYEMSNVAPLRNALGSQKETISSLKAERDALNTKVENLTTQIASAGEGKEDVSKQVEAQVAAATDKLSQDLAKATNQLEAKDKLINEHVLKSTATAAILSAGGKNVDLLLPHVINRLRVEESDGNLSVVPVQKDGSPWISSKSGSTAVGTVDELVASDEFKTSSVFAVCFNAEDTAGGTGEKTVSKPNNDNGSGSTEPKNTMSPAQRLAQIRANESGAGS